ncbi:hypothetical protein K3556_04015 [Aliiroseovarius sp. M344]|uniref:hypothetical protein n=1 Tax=Aliiroseovarius sp. M344 TaxID=2867010 RepID=UPI0021ADFEE0|nr:hypothetical protein [Aliiroseovarius sp. M344]UWQ15069.1 hypothetical protein K3556_04015 [Aliiroseovarius sp. M344]
MIWQARAFSLRDAGLLASLSLVSLGLAGCDRNNADDLRAELEQRFFLGETLFFESKQRCTAAVFRATENDVKQGVVSHDDPETAQAAYRREGTAVFRRAGLSPHDLTDILLMSGDGAFGKQALAAAALVEGCLTKEISIGFKVALTRPGATLAISDALGGVIILDPVDRKLYFAAGDPV